MSKLFEVFGYPLTNGSTLAENTRRSAICPFMRRPCDGGGNRAQSQIDLTKHPELQNYFSGVSANSVATGVCSLQLQSHQSAWVTCPRRLFTVRDDVSPEQYLQRYVLEKILQLANFPQSTLFGIWDEIKVKHTEVDKVFDYTFDYLLLPLDMLESNNDNDFSPIIIEVMTASTSGGNRKERTAMPLAFEDALLHGHHKAPSINYRQVWARMISQMIVKSEIALAWGGKTIWILQDVLADYISKTTALDLENFRSDKLSEVNILSLSYPTNHNTNLPHDLQVSQFYSGNIRPFNLTHQPSFLDMIQLGTKPDKSILLQALKKHPPKLKFSIE
jgi:hypothetical protein